MDHQRIIIIGCPGSGKSTFSKRLAKIIGLPLYHLDMIFHHSDRTTISKEEFDSKLGEILAQDRWIIDGNYSRTLEWRLTRADLVVYFDIPVEDCLEGIRSRIGKNRGDLPWIEETLDEEFKAYVERFPETQNIKLKQILLAHPEVDQISFTSRIQADEYLETLGRK